MTQFESRVSEAEDRFRIMADSAPVMLWMSEPDGRCTFFNQVWLQFTGRTMMQETNFGWSEGVHPEDFQLCMDSFIQALSAKTTFTIEYRLRRHDGEYRWILDNGVPRYLNTGEFAGYIGSCIDITERKVLEEEREQLLASELVARKEAERLYTLAQEAGRLKDEFLATVSHELRTPLNAILGWAQLLLAEESSPEVWQTALETIVRNGKIQLRLIEDTVDMSRALAGKMELKIVPFDLNLVIYSAVETIRPLAHEKNIDVSIQVPRDRVMMTGDAERLQQVVGNLLTNAVKFTPQGGKVQVTCQRLDQDMEIQIKDSGIGISPEFLPHVFDRFRQEDGRITRRHGGLGLGLSIVKSLVELHRGTVRAESPGRDQGAVFTVCLPLQGIPSLVSLRSRQFERLEPRRPAAAQEIRRLLVGIKVLIVDDQNDVLHLLKTILDLHGASVQMATSVATAIVSIEQTTPDVIISDIGMPKESGYDLIRKLRLIEVAAGRQIPIAALTAHCRSEDKEHILSAGFQMHLAKPIEPATLITSVARLAGRTPLVIN